MAGMYERSDQMAFNLMKSSMFTASLSAAALLVACGGGGGGSSSSAPSTPVTPPPAPTGSAFTVSGGTLKGILRDATVKISDPDNPSETFVADVTTAANGKYTISVPQAANFNGDFVKITVEGGGGATMVCDAAPDCAGTAFGDAMPIDSSFTLSAITPVPAPNGSAVLNISVFSDLAASYAQSLPGGLNAANLEAARTSVANMFMIPGENLDMLPMTDITVAAQASVDQNGYKAAMLSGGVLGAAQDDNLAIGAALAGLRNAIIAGAGTLPMSEVTDTSAITLEEIFEAAIAAADLSPVTAADYLAAKYQLLLDSVPVTAQSRDRAFDESNFFTDLVTDSNPQVLTQMATTAQLQSAIDLASAEAGGGVVQLVDAATYNLGRIFLKSNVRLEIAPGATIIPTSDRLFNIAGGRNVSRLQNVEITTIGRTGQFTIDTTGFGINENMRPFQVGWVENASFSNFVNTDGRTKFSTIAFTIGADRNPIPGNPSWGNIAENVVVKNASITGAHYGYGFVQLQGGRNILFKNISTIGGAALRLETGDDNSNLAGPDIGGVHDIYAENVSCTRGQTALTLSPHNKLNGKIVVRNLTSEDCALGVNIAAGFINIGLRDNPDITPGAFVVRPTILNVDVTRTVGEQRATIKFKDFNRIPVSLRGGLAYGDLLDSGDNDSKLFDPVVPIAALSMLSLENPGPMEDGYYGVIIDPDDVTSYADTDPIRDEFYFDVP